MKADLNIMDLSVSDRQRMLSKGKHWSKSALNPASFFNLLLGSNESEREKFPEICLETVTFTRGNDVPEVGS